MRSIVILSYVLLMGLCCFTWIAERKIEAKIQPHFQADQARINVENITSLGRAKDLLGRALLMSEMLEDTMRRLIRQHRGMMFFALLLALPGVFYALQQRPERASRAERSTISILALADMDWGWWPLLHLRPKKNELISFGRLLLLTAIVGTAAGVLILAYLFLKKGTLASTHVAVTLIWAWTSFFFGSWLTYGREWNRRALLLQREANQTREVTQTSRRTSD